MAWTAYRLVYQAKSPIHIGWHTLGYIKLTRYYITGKNMWGAATANLTRTLGVPGTSEYKTIGNILKKYILFSYFYPALDLHSPLLPEFTDKGLQYGKFLGPEFEQLFIRSFGQTAVTPDTNTAEDETLHESEFIVPMIYNEGKKMQEPVYFVGYIFISDDTEYKWAAIKDAIKEIFVGGDRKYGWGRLVLYREIEDEKVFGLALPPDKDKPEVTIPSGHAVPAHTSINQDLRIKGDVEPLVGRDWGEVMNEEGKKKVGFGQQISRADICWMPGSVLMEETTFNIGEYGILQKKETKDG
ncbi:MAG: hypothetical protein WA133_13140 [Syntrophales bacterium]